MVDISVKNLTKFFVIGENLLEDLTFEIQEGECVAILGRNGCGKTTLFNILTGQMDYDSGEVYVNPHKKLGLISQIPRFPEGYRVEDVLRCAYTELFQLKAKMERLEQEEMEARRNKRAAKEAEKAEKAEQKVKTEAAKEEKKNAQEQPAAEVKPEENDRDKWRGWGCG